MIRVTYNYVLTFVLFITVKADTLDDRFRILYSKNFKCEHNRSLNLDVSETRVYFYDFVKNINISSRIDTAADLLRKSIELGNSRRIIVFVPGYKSQIKKDIEELVRQTYKSVPNIYLIIIDHSPYTYENKEKLQSYSRSVKYAYYIGTSLGKFLSDFCDRKIPPDNVHCIGHSLGSHIIGYAGETFTNITKEKLWRITGLDPAGPCFSNGPVEEHIRSGVGKYVEVYHCNAGYLGTTRTIADTDFFFNYDGKIQPDCDAGDNLEETVKCYHKACVKYWMKTVHNPELYVARSCPSYKAFAEGLCEENETTTAGCYNPGDARGIFYVSTNTYP